MSSNIYSITGREILDSRGSPTIEVTTILESGYRGTAAVPSGASKGKYESLELRDNNKERYGGFGVLTAVGNVNTTLNAALKGKDALKQAEVDKVMIDLDGTPNKSKLGANAILGVSLSVAVAAASQSHVPLYVYLNAMFSALHPTKMDKIPTPTFNMINGGKHGTGNLDFQEFHVVPASNKPFSEALEMGVEIYYAARSILKYRNAVHSIGDEGGFAPNLFTNLDALEVLHESIRSTKYRVGTDVFLGLDLAASSFFKQTGYQIKDRAMKFSREEFIEYLQNLHKNYRVLILEDPLEEDDWAGWKELTAKLGESVLIVGDDLLVTSVDRLNKAIEEKACSAILAKPNQIGSLTEFLQVINIAKKHDIKVIVSHRSGETTDTFIADLAVAVQSEYVKFGAPARGERVVKYNRLLQIESELIGRK